MSLLKRHRFLLLAALVGLIALLVVFGPYLWLSAACHVVYCDL